MNEKISTIINEMIKYYAKDPRRVNHFLKVFSFAKSIGELENIDKKTQEILEVAAVMHDIGIKVSEENIILLLEIIKSLKGLQLQRKCFQNLILVKNLLKEYAI
ncbi:HD superfamily phosphohydrolase YqeK [Clostridium beijerinckii]|nr:HD superfamily phosphohydrolase YqeK [Clostridium beijerinckii]